MMPAIYRDMAYCSTQITIILREFYWQAYTARVTADGLAKITPLKLFRFRARQIARMAGRLEEEIKKEIEAVEDEIRDGSCDFRKICEKTCLIRRRVELLVQATRHLSNLSAGIMILRARHT